MPPEEEECLLSIPAEDLMAEDVRQSVGYKIRFDLNHGDPTSTSEAVIELLRTVYDLAGRIEVLEHSVALLENDNSAEAL